MNKRTSSSKSKPTSAASNSAALYDDSGVKIRISGVAAAGGTSLANANSAKPVIKGNFSSKLGKAMKASADNSNKTLSQPGGKKVSSIGSKANPSGFDAVNGAAQISAAKLNELLNLHANKSNNANQQNPQDNRRVSLGAPAPEPLSLENTPETHYRHIPATVPKLSAVQQLDNAYPINTAPQRIHTASDMSSNRFVSPVELNRTKNLGSSIFNAATPNDTMSMTITGSRRKPSTHQLAQEEATIQTNRNIPSHRNHSQDFNSSYSNLNYHNNFNSNDHNAANNGANSPGSNFTGIHNSDHASIRVHAPAGGISSMQIGGFSADDSVRKAEEQQKKLEQKRLLDQQIEQMRSAKQQQNSQQVTSYSARHQPHARSESGHTPAAALVSPQHRAGFSQIGYDENQMKSLKQQQQLTNRAELEKQIAENQRRKQEEKARLEYEQQQEELKIRQQFEHKVEHPPHQQQYSNHLQPNSLQPSISTGSLHSNSGFPASLSPSRVAENRSVAMKSSVFGGAAETEQRRRIASDLAKHELRQQIEDRKRAKEAEKLKLEEEERKDNIRLMKEQYELYRRHQISQGITPDLPPPELMHLFQQPTNATEKQQQQEQHYSSPPRRHQQQIQHNYHNEQQQQYQGHSPQQAQNDDYDNQADEAADENREEQVYQQPIRRPDAKHSRVRSDQQNSHSYREQYEEEDSQAQVAAAQPRRRVQSGRADQAPSNKANRKAANPAEQQQQQQQQGAAPVRSRSAFSANSARARSKAAIQQQEPRFKPEKYKLKSKVKATEEQKAALLKQEREERKAAVAATALAAIGFKPPRHSSAPRAPSNKGAARARPAEEFQRGREQSYSPSSRSRPLHSGNNNYYNAEEDYYDEYDVAPVIKPRSILKAPKVSFPDQNNSNQQENRQRNRPNELITSAEQPFGKSLHGNSAFIFPSKMGLPAYSKAGTISDDLSLGVDELDRIMNSYGQTSKLQQNHEQSHEQQQQQQPHRYNNQARANLLRAQPNKQILLPRLENNSSASNSATPVRSLSPAVARNYYSDQSDESVHGLLHDAAAPSTAPPVRVGIKPVNPHSPAAGTANSSSSSYSQRKARKPRVVDPFTLHTPNNNRAAEKISATPISDYNNSNYDNDAFES
jgi:hypothetical protein